MINKSKDKESKKKVVNHIINSHSKFKELDYKFKIEAKINNILENEDLTPNHKNRALKYIVSKIFNKGVTNDDKHILDKIIDSLKSSSDNKSLLKFIINKSNLYKKNDIVTKIKTNFSSNKDIQEYIKTINKKNNNVKISSPIVEKSAPNVKNNKKTVGNNANSVEKSEQIVENNLKNNNATKIKNNANSIENPTPNVKNNATKIKNNANSIENPTPNVKNNATKIKNNANRVENSETNVGKSALTIKNSPNNQSSISSKKKTYLGKLFSDIKKTVVSPFKKKKLTENNIKKLEKENFNKIIKNINILCNTLVNKYDSVITIKNLDNSYNKSKHYYGNKIIYYAYLILYNIIFFFEDDNNKSITNAYQNYINKLKENINYNSKNKSKKLNKIINDSILKSEIIYYAYKKLFDIIKNKNNNNNKNINNINKYCKILEIVPDNLTKATIKSAYRKLALKYHPNKGGNEEKFKEINNAQDELLKIIEEKGIINIPKPIDIIYI